MRLHIVLAALAVVAPIAAPLAQATQIPSQRTDVPVRTVILYSSGVGYFEHAGTVRGTGATELRFKTNQINDILKSLVLRDDGGGRFSTITYPSQDPLAKTLRSFQVDITSNPSLADLLNQLRGAAVTIQMQGERISGTIIGVERRRRILEKGDAMDAAVLNLLTGAMIRSVDLQSITSLSLDDPRLQDELTRALTTVSQARDQDRKPVTINFSGNGDRRLRIGYVVEAPVWKTSYRLLLNDRGANLQGWAIVENQTESDWNGVSLSLVSGRPISFMMDLYQPLYATRPTVVQELLAHLRPQLYDAGIAQQRERAEFGDAMNRRDAAAGGIMAPQAAARARLSESLMDVVTTGAASDMASSVQSLAFAEQMGELFQYSVGNVTLPRQESAMIPIITDSVSVDRVSIYNAAVLRKHPLNGVRIRNITGKHLLQGPITVLDGERYAGDARIDNVPPGQERLISYGVDLDLVVDNTKNGESASIVSGRILRGIFHLGRKQVASLDYQIDNKGTRDRTVVIEHPIRQGWKLASSVKPIETTATHYRFQGLAPAGKVTTLTVKEELVRDETIAILPADIGPLLTYSRTGEIPQAVRDALARAIQLKQAVVETERQLAALVQRIAEITAEQNRMRENMKTVGQTSSYYTRLLAKLDEQESSIEKLQAERTDLQRTRDSQRRALEQYLAELTVG